MILATPFLNTKTIPLNEDWMENLINNSTKIQDFTSSSKIVRKPKSKSQPPSPTTPLNIQPSIQETLNDNLAKEITDKNKIHTNITEKKKNIEKRKTDKAIVKKLQELPDLEYKTANELIREELKEVEKAQIPEEVDVIETEQTINEIQEFIPDPIPLDKLEFTKIDKKTKKGYYKCKVSIKKSDIPEQINKIASYIKQASKGLIKPRVTDLRIIGNTNKTQLRSSKLKLTSSSVTFRPEHGKMKVNKGTRIILSIPEDYDSAKELLMYLQEGRKKELLRVHKQKGASEESYNQWIGDRIAEFFFKGYDVVSLKLQLRSEPNPLMDLIDLIVKTNEYKARPHTDNNHIYAVDFMAKSNSKNQWLYINVSEFAANKYDVYAMRFNDDGEFEVRLAMTKPNKDHYSIDDLKQNLYMVMGLAYGRDWTKDLDIAGTDPKNIEKKLKHFTSELGFKQMKNAYKELVNYVLNELDEGYNVELEIDRIITKRDFETKTNLNGESVVGHTKYCKFILSYLLIPLKQADKRNSKDFITSDYYYQVTNVKDKRPAQERPRSLTVKEGANRNYNTGAFVFQLEYETKERKHKFVSKTFEEMLEETNFLTDRVKYPLSKYDKYLK